MDNVMSADFWEKHVKESLDPQKASQLDRIVVAGMKVMFSKETHHLMLDELDSDAPVSDKLAQGIAKLMIMLYEQSSGTMPPDLIIPAAGILMAKAVEFMVKSGEQVTEDDFSVAMGEMVKIVFKQAGASEQEIAKLAGDAQADVQGAAGGAATQMATAPAGMLAQQGG